MGQRQVTFLAVRAVVEVVDRSSLKQLYGKPANLLRRAVV